LDHGTQTRKRGENGQIRLPINIDRRNLEFRPLLKRFSARLFWNGVVLDNEYVCFHEVLIELWPVGGIACGLYERPFEIVFWRKHHGLLREKTLGGRSSGFEVPILHFSGNANNPPPSQPRIQHAAQFVPWPIAGLLSTAPRRLLTALTMPQSRVLILGWGVLDEGNDEASHMRFDGRGAPVKIVPLVSSRPDCLKVILYV
jgi:hypothetical protein